MTESLFSEQEILAFINDQCPQAEAATIVSKNRDRIEAKSRRGATLIVPCHQRWPFLLGLRSVLKVRKNATAYSFLINGQGGKNTKTLGFWGETGPCLIPSQKRFELYLNKVAGTPCQLAREDALRMWKHGAGAHAHPTETHLVENLGYTNQLAPRVLNTRN